jgi:hypothetical protein
MVISACFKKEVRVKSSGSCLVTLAIWEAEIRKTVLKASPGKYFVRAYLQNNQSKMDWRCSSSGRTPTKA